MKQITPGVQGEATVQVTSANTAVTMKSGALPVFATPAMCALMEEAACAAIQSFLEDGEGTVGTKLAISHTAPSGVGATIRAVATVVQQVERKIDFEVEAYMGDVCIGNGIHERFLINNEKFMSRVQVK